MRHNDFENTPMIKLVMGLAIPSMIAQLVNILYSIVDRMFVGQIEEVGNLCLAAVGICGPIVTLLSSFGTLVGIGGSIWLSMCLGQKNEKRASQILYNSFVVLVVLSLCLTLGFILLKHNLIYWFGGSDALYPYANTYLTIYTLGTFFALMSIGLNYFITGQGYATIAMLSVCIGAITNIIFDFIFTVRYTASIETGTANTKEIMKWQISHMYEYQQLNRTNSDRLKLLRSTTLISGTLKRYQQKT